MTAVPASAPARYKSECSLIETAITALTAAKTSRRVKYGPPTEKSLCPDLNFDFKPLSAFLRLPPPIN
jgi:hypothetical protein